MLGSNQEYLETQLPNIRQILCENCQDILNKCQVIVICQNHPKFATAIQAIAENNLNVIVIDLVH
jgi:ribosomal protein L36